MPRSDFTEAYFFKYSVENKLTALSEAIRKSLPDAEANAKKFFDAKAQKKGAKPVAKKEAAAKTQPKKASASDVTSDIDAANLSKPATKQTLTSKLQPKKADVKAPSSDSSSDSDAPATIKPSVVQKVDAKKSTIEAPRSDSSSGSDAPVPAKSVVSKKTQDTKERSKMVPALSKECAEPVKIMNKHEAANEPPQSMPRPRIKRKSPATARRRDRLAAQQNASQHIQSRPGEDWAPKKARLQKWWEL